MLKHTQVSEVLLPVFGFIHLKWQAVVRLTAACHCNCRCQHKLSCTLLASQFNKSVNFFFRRRSRLPSPYFAALILVCLLFSFLFIFAWRTFPFLFLSGLRAPYASAGPFVSHLKMRMEWNSKNDTPQYRKERDKANGGWKENWMKRLSECDVGMSGRHQFYDEYVWTYR